MIRLAVRCAPEQADLVLAELTVLAPNGVEEERGPGYVEYAIYGGEGELPELGSIDAVVAGRPIEVTSTEIPDDWADRWRDFHKPLLVGERLWLRPSWEPAREGAIDLIVDPGQAFGTGAHPTTRLCLEYLLELADAGEAGGPLVDLGTGSGVLAIAAAKLGWSPVTGYDHEGAAIEASAANAEVNNVEIELYRTNLRESLPDARPDGRRQHDLADPEGDRNAPERARRAAEHPGPLRHPPQRAGRSRRGIRPCRIRRARPAPARRLGRASPPPPAIR